MATGRLLLGASVVASLWAVMTWLTGGFGFRLGTLSISSHDVVRPALAAGLLLIASRAVLGRDVLARYIGAGVGDARSAPRRIALAAALAMFVAAVAWNTRASGGSDSSCYLIQADVFARGEALLRDPLASRAPFSNVGRLFAPTGWTEAPADPRAAAPICPPGLALLMTIALAGGRAAPALVVPLFAALAVWLTFLFGRYVDGPWTGAAAAVLLACSPIFLYQAVQPMSDVPAAALWMAALVSCARRDRTGDVLAGVCAGLAVLTRPNLAVAILPLVVWIAFDPEAPVRARVSRLGRFASASVPLVILLAALNVVRYGSPAASGYGATGQLFAASHVAPNVVRYARWLVATQTPFVLIALIGPWWAWRRGRFLTMAMTIVSLAAAVLVFCTYLAYVVFDDWWYIRFLLPVLPTLIVLSVAITGDLVRAFSPRWRTAIGGAGVVALASWYLHTADVRQVFALQAIEARFLITGEYVARALPVEATALAVQQSGSIWYHGRRSTMTWDAIDPGDLDRTIAWLNQSRRPPFIALEDIEEPRFRRRFAGQTYGALDWPPAAEIHARVRVRIYDVAQRAVYLERGRVATEHIRP